MRTLLSLVGAGLLLAVNAWSASNIRTKTDSADDLAGYRTVATAITTQAVKMARVPVGQSGFLGISGALDKRGQFIVEEAAPDSPAAKAGVQPGDVLLKVAGEPIKTPDQLRALIQTRAPGDTVPLLIERKRKRVELTATLGATSRPMKYNAQRAQLGVRFSDPEKGEGAAIERITRGSAAASAGLKEGDVVLRIDGTPVISGDFARERIEEKQDGDTVKLSLTRGGEEMELQAQLTAPDTSREGRARNLWKKDVFRLAVLLVEYPDTKHNDRVTTQDWTEFFFSTNTYLSRSNITGQLVHGSVNDYYREVSCGALRIEGKVFDWLEASRRRAEYAQGSNANSNGRSVLLNEMLDKLREREGTNVLTDFDGLLYIYAGDRMQTANRGSLYWPHMGGTTYRGKRWNYFICAEGRRRMADISVFCHEFGHMLGLPDLYARPENPGSEGLGSWCLMSQQSGNGRPQHPGAWCKEQLGWLKPAVIDPQVKQKLILAPVEGTTNECFKVLARPDGSEYFLLENRRKTGFDRSLAAEGLLVWRVVGNRPILEESHGVEGASGPRAFPTSVPFPSTANNAFTPYTTPSSRSLLGGGLPVNITNIRQLSDGRIAFQVGYEFE